MKKQRVLLVTTAVTTVESNSCCATWWRQCTSEVLEYDFLDTSRHSHRLGNDLQYAAVRDVEFGGVRVSVDENWKNTVPNTHRKMTGRLPGRVLCGGQTRHWEEFEQQVQDEKLHTPFDIVKVPEDR